MGETIPGERNPAVSMTCATRPDDDEDARSIRDGATASSSYHEDPPMAAAWASPSSQEDPVMADALQDHHRNRGEVGGVI